MIQASDISEHDMLSDAERNVNNTLKTFGFPVAYTCQYCAAAQAKPSNFVSKLAEVFESGDYDFFKTYFFILPGNAPGFRSTDPAGILFSCIEKDRDNFFNLVLKMCKAYQTHKS